MIRCYCDRSDREATSFLLTFKLVLGNQKSSCTYVGYVIRRDREMSFKSLKLTLLSLPILTIPGIKLNQYYNRNFKYPQNVIHEEWFENTKNNNNKKNVIVIGTGINGLCSAYQLSKLSKQNEYINKIAIIDKNYDMADECTKAAAGGMARQYSSLDKHIG